MFENLFPLPPIAFFAIGADCHYLKGNKEEALEKKYLLPSLERFYAQDSFAEIFMGWNEEGLLFTFKFKNPLLKSIYPAIQEGDSVEIFIDTRDVKSSGMNTKFCHHFFFLPEMPDDDLEAKLTGEITYFKSDDSHPHCEDGVLFCKTTKKLRGYQMQIFIPKEALFGYDPAGCPRLGFSYRINRWGHEPQFFSMPSPEYLIDEQPSLWASLKLLPPQT